VPIVRIGLPRSPKGCNRHVTLTEPRADFSEREPGGCKAGSDVGCLLQELCGARKVASKLQVARKLKPPVRNQIAGGQE
jgi:hypothetical protein